VTVAALNELSFPEEIAAQRWLQSISAQFDSQLCELFRYLAATLHGSRIHTRVPLHELG